MLLAGLLNESPLRQCPCRLGEVRSECRSPAPSSFMPAFLPCVIRTCQWFIQGLPYFVLRDFGSVRFFCFFLHVALFRSHQYWFSSRYRQSDGYLRLHTYIFKHLKTIRKKRNSELSANASVYIFTTSPNCTFLVLTYTDSVPKPVTTLYTCILDMSVISCSISVRYPCIRYSQSYLHCCVS